MKLNENDVHLIVEYIKTVGVDFDAADVEEDVEAVLWQYGYYDSLSDEDVAALRQELLPLGLQQEVAEVQRTVLVEPEVGAW